MRYQVAGGQRCPPRVRLQPSTTALLLLLLMMMMMTTTATMLPIDVPQTCPYYAARGLSGRLSALLITNGLLLEKTIKRLFPCVLYCAVPSLCFLTNTKRSQPSVQPPGNVRPCHDSSPPPALKSRATCVHLPSTKQFQIRTWRLYAILTSGHKHEPS